MLWITNAHSTKPDLGWMTQILGGDRLGEYLRELGLELVVDVLEGAAEGGELLARLLGDEHLGHAVPVDRLAGLHRHIGHLLRAAAAHLRRPAAASSLPPVAPLSRCRRRAALRPHEEMGMVVVLALWAESQAAEYLVGSNGPRRTTPLLGFDRAVCPCILVGLLSPPKKFRLVGLNTTASPFFAFSARED